MMTMIETSFLEQKAKKVRREVLNLAIIEREAHLGGSFSIIEIVISLYDIFLKKDDKFILSKGHSCYPMYVMLKERGYNPRIRAHPDMDRQNQIHCTTGSLGHGLPMGLGMAFAKKFKKLDGRIYVLISDGECQEGTTWESLLLASHHKLGNLTVIVDYNKIQALNLVKNVLSLGNLKGKFESFGCHVKEVDGHSFDQLISALKDTREGIPSVIIANTVKGKGVSYMENVPKWHTRLPTKEELQQAYQELAD